MIIASRKWSAEEIIVRAKGEMKVLATQHDSNDSANDTIVALLQYNDLLVFLVSFSQLFIYEKPDRLYVCVDNEKNAFYEIDLSPAINPNQLM